MTTSPDPKNAISFIAVDFSEAGKKKNEYYSTLKKNILALLNSLERYKSKEETNTPQAEKDIQAKFSKFLESCGFYMALSDFDDLIKESQAESRNDGSIAWYHQLTQILMFLSLVQNNTILLKDIEKYGGLETAIRTSLRHDSIEDFGKDFDQFEEMQQNKIKLVYANLEEKNISVLNDERQAEEENNLKILMQNLRLMTKKIAMLDKNGEAQYHSDGRMIKKNLFSNTPAYIHNMLNSEQASPIVWIFKVLDGSHNLATMIGAPKFNAPRRLKYSNEREDMYGSRQSLPERAIEKWPNFETAIKNVDAMMGAILYTNFGYLEYVDQEDAYSRNSGKFKDGEEIYVSGIGKFMDKALSIKLPRGFNPLHNLFDTIQHLAVTEKDSEKRKKIKNFWKKSINPALKPYASHFSKNAEIRATNQSFPTDNTTYAPNFL